LAGTASRYARAIFELAREEGRVAEWSQQLAVIREVLEDPAAEAVVANPSVPFEVRMRAVEQLDLPGIDAEGMNLMRMLVGSARANRVGEIADRFETLADDAAGRVKATVTTAIPLSDGDRESLRKDLSSRLGKDVRLESRVDPTILGGLLLQVGDRLTDATVAARLDQLRRRVLVN
jgi:F-type H+-transporting ATPase subunit delta